VTVPLASAGENHSTPSLRTTVPPLPSFATSVPRGASTISGNVLVSTLHLLAIARAARSAAGASFSGAMPSSVSRLSIISPSTPKTTPVSKVLGS
jgi:hypothetical protein